MWTNICISCTGRRMEGLNPGEYKSTMNPTKPVSIEGHWQEPTPDEQDKHDTVHQLQTHLSEVKAHQRKPKKRLVIDTNKRLYTQPSMVGDKCFISLRLRLETK